MPLWAHHFRLLVPVVTYQLAEILKAQTHGNLVTSRGGDKIVQPLEVYRRKLVNDDRRLQHAFLVDELHDTGIIQTESRTVNVLTVRIVAQAICPINCSAAPPSHASMNGER